MTEKPCSFSLLEYWFLASLQGRVAALRRDKSCDICRGLLPPLILISVLSTPFTHQLWPQREGCERCVMFAQRAQEGRGVSDWNLQAQTGLMCSTYVWHPNTFLTSAQGGSLPLSDHDLLSNDSLQYCQPGYEAAQIFTGSSVWSQRWTAGDVQKVRLTFKKIILLFLVWKVSCASVHVKCYSPLVLVPGGLFWSSGVWAHQLMSPKSWVVSVCSTVRAVKCWEALGLL